MVPSHAGPGRSGTRPRLAGALNPLSAGSQTRRRKLPCRAGLPVGLVKTSASASCPVWLRCQRIRGMIRLGINTVGAGNGLGGPYA
jgi:hypothetical protein